MRLKAYSLGMLFVFMTLSQTLVSNVHASSEIDNWPENDAWLNIELISWEANQSIEWDNNGGLPDPQFKICVEADSVSIDCVNTPTWDNQYTLTNVWNYSIDIPDESNILNITIECEDNDALNDDECDMNSDIAEWKLFYEYNWSSNPVVEYSSSGNEDETNNWKDAASIWSFKIDGYGDEDNDGITDNIDLCNTTMEGEPLLNQTQYIGCSWMDLDIDLDGVINYFDTNPYNSHISKSASNYLNSISELADESWTEIHSQVGYGFSGIPMINFNSSNLFLIRDGLIDIETGVVTHYSDIFCHNEITSGECVPLNNNDLFGEVQVFDFDGDNDLDIFIGNRLYVQYEGKFWRHITENSCSSNSNILWLDLEFDGTTDLYCYGSAGRSPSLLQSYCRDYFDMKYEPSSGQWILVCQKPYPTPDSDDRSKANNIQC